MISVYNETKAAWEIENLNKNVIRFVKTKEKKEVEGNDRKRVVSVITYTPLFDNVEKLKQTLLKSKVTPEPIKISDKSTSIIFNNKEFKPIITAKNHNQKNVLLGSIFLQGRKFIRVKNVNTFLLEFFIFGAEFSFIASFNTDDAVFSFDLLNEKTGVVTHYKFYQKDGQVVKEVSERGVTEKDKQSNFRARIFRPSRPTNIILVHPKDKAELEKTIDVTRHHVIEYTELNNAIEAVKTQKFKAVTLFAKSKIGEETDIEKKRYGYVTDMLTRRFQTVFKLHLDGKVDKVKY